MPEPQDTFVVGTPRYRLQAPERIVYPVGAYAWPISGFLVPQATACSGDVLLLGRDFRLQSTRASLLEKVGFRCHLAAEADMVLCMAQRHFEVILLCHTLPVTEARQAVEHVRLRFPLSVMLRLAKYLQAEEECFEHLLILPRPGELVAMVQYLSLLAGRTA